MKKICLLLVLCLFLSACSAFAEETGEVSALIEQAWTAIETGDYETAVPLLQKAADLGDATGQLWLGNCCSAGLGIQQDDKEAAKYYQLAADQGNANAQFNLGFAYYVGQGVDPDYDEAFRLFQLAADQGFPVAMFAVGDCYCLGTGVGKDLGAAAEWYRKALNAGYEPDETDTAHMKEVFGEVSDTGEGETEPFRYVHDPRQNPNAMQDIVENPAAVYGFSPDPNSTRLGNYADYDWTDPVFVAEAKKNREEYHASMESMMEIVYKMRDEGATMEAIARAVSAERNRVRLAASENDPEELAKVRESNLKTYGSEEGPTPDQLYEKYGSWQTVLQKAFSPNLGMDAVCGLYDDNYDLYVELGLAEP